MDGRYDQELIECMISKFRSGEEVSRFEDADGHAGWNGIKILDLHFRHCLFLVL